MNSYEISMQDESKAYIKVGFARPSKSGKAMVLTLFTNKLDELPRSKCGTFINLSMVQSKFTKVGE